MTKKHLKFWKGKIFLFLCLFLFIISCQKQDLSPLSELNQKLTKEGLIRLKSVDDINVIVEQMKLSNNFNVRKIVRTKVSDSAFDDSFISLRERMIEDFMMTLSETERYEIQQEELIYEPEDSLILDPYYSAILNENREIQIEDKIYRYVEEGLLVYDYDPDKPFLPETINNYPHLEEGDHASVIDGNGNIAELYWISYDTEESLQTGREGGVVNPKSPKNSNNDNEIVQPIENRTLSLQNGVTISREDLKSAVYKNKGGTGSWLQKGISSLFGKNVTITNHFNSTHRMKLRMFSQDYFIYRTCGMTVRMQKKKLGIWWRTKAEEFRYGWSPIEIEYKYKSVKVPQPQGSKSAYPDCKSKKFPFSESNIDLFYIPFINYDFTTGDLNKIYKAAVKGTISLIKEWFKDPNAQESQKHRIGFYTTNNEIEYVIIPHGENISVGHGRDVVRFKVEWFKGKYVIGFKMGNRFKFDTAEVESLSSLDIKRGRVYAAVKYNGVWKACEIYTE